MSHSYTYSALVFARDFWLCCFNSGYLTPELPLPEYSLMFVGFAGELTQAFSKQQLHCTSLATVLKQKKKGQICLSCFAIFQMTNYRSWKFLKTLPFCTKLTGATTVLPALDKRPHQPANPPVLLPVVQSTQSSIQSTDHGETKKMPGSVQFKMKTQLASFPIWGIFAQPEYIITKRFWK